VVSALDLDAVYSSYNEKDSSGLSAYAPALMVRVLLYGYATGVYNSRKIQNKSYDDVAFRFLSADEPPDHSTLAELRKRHLQALGGLSGVAAFSQGRLGQAWPGSHRRHQDQGERRAPHGRVFVRGVEAGRSDCGCGLLERGQRIGVCKFGR
jgi:hypothetical protein